MDFSIIAKAGLRNSDFSSITGTSRALVGLWVKGEYSPRHGKPYYEAVDKTVELLQALVDAGKLPIKFRDLSHRRAVVEKIAAKVSPNKNAAA